MLPDISAVHITPLNDPLFIEKKLAVEVLRLDEIHPVVSGNKLFKLYYFIEEALHSSHRCLLSFGGAYSNHLVATAYAGMVSGIRTIGIVRGERPEVLSQTLTDCLQYKMQLKFISREAYAAKEESEFAVMLQGEFGAHILIPEGGYHPNGARGASLILQQANRHDYTHLFTAMGTATTLAGLLLAARPGQQVTGVNVLKGEPDTMSRIKFLTGRESYPGLQLLNDYHFGGYAKKTDELILFMNDCFRKYSLPLDFVYTAKMMYAVMDMIRSDQFAPGSKILCIHTGGLQGNRSLPVDTLLY
jgi:1-aminocyclopropane-1-carboxylate deaminase